jgi:hypothetical protein
MNERQIALHIVENLKEKTVPVQPGAQESAIDASGQREWLERKLQELTQAAGV